jgi:hypothetical protein
VIRDLKYLSIPSGFVNVYRLVFLFLRLTELAANQGHATGANRFASASRRPTMLPGRLLILNVRPTMLPGRLLFARIRCHPKQHNGHQFAQCDLVALLCEARGGFDSESDRYLKAGPSPSALPQIRRRAGMLDSEGDFAAAAHSHPKRTPTGRTRVRRTRNAGRPPAFRTNGRRRKP